MGHYQIPWGLFLREVLHVLAYFGLIPGVAAAYGARKLRQKRHQRKAAGWLAVTANIHWGQVDNIGAWPFPQYWAEITYSFFASEYRSGTYVRKFRREADAEEFIRQTKGKQIQVHFQEEDPAQSVLLDRDLEMIALLTPQLS